MFDVRDIIYLARQTRSGKLLCHDDTDDDDDGGMFDGHIYDYAF